jgi:DNA polymerase sigma
MKDTRPSENVIQARKATISRLNTTINSAFGGGYLVKSFGSTVYGIDHAKSDLDLVVLVSQSPMMLGLA